VFSRRRVLASCLAAPALLRLRPAVAEAILTDDGTYREPWFLDSFLDLAEDLEGAAQNGKRLAVVWELRGCPYCREMHLVNFAKPEIENYVKERFEILQLNIVGSREVTDFDGEKLSEKRIAEKYGVRFTPTLQFFPEKAQGLGARAPRQREVVRTQGYQEPKDFAATFRFVAERAYERTTLREFLRSQS
jgi:thioredoxin-related protein